MRTKKKPAKPLRPHPPRPTLKPNGRRMGRPPIRTANTSRSWFLALRDWGCSLAVSARDAGLTMHEGRKLDAGRKCDLYEVTPLPPGFRVGLVPQMPARRRASLVRKVLARRLWRRKRLNELSDALSRSVQTQEFPAEEALACAAYWLAQGLGLEDAGDDGLATELRPHGVLPATPGRARLALRWIELGRPGPPPPSPVETVEEAVAYVIRMIEQARRTNRIRQRAKH